MSFGLDRQTGRFHEKAMKSPLIRLIVIGFFGAWLLTACSSSDDEVPQDEFYISFKVDGTLVRYENAGFYPVVLSKDSPTNLYFSNLIVLKEVGESTSNFVHINVRNESAFQTNLSYQMQDGVLYPGGVFLARIQFTWANDAGEIYNAALLQRSYPTLDIGDDAAFKFTKIAGDIVEGTFTATVYGPVINSVPNRTVEKKITEGEFRLKLIDSVP